MAASDKFRIDENQSHIFAFVSQENKLEILDNIEVLEIDTYAKDNMGRIIYSIIRDLGITETDNLSNAAKKRILTALDFFEFSQLFNSILNDLDEYLSKKNYNVLRGIWPRQQVFRYNLMMKIKINAKSSLDNYHGEIYNHVVDEPYFNSLADSDHIDYQDDDNIPNDRKKRESIKRKMEELIKDIDSMKDLTTIANSIKRRMIYLKKHKFKYGEYVRYRNFNGIGFNYGYIEEIGSDEYIKVKPANPVHASFWIHQTKISNWK